MSHGGAYYGRGEKPDGIDLERATFLGNTVSEWMVQYLDGKEGWDEEAYYRANYLLDIYGQKNQENIFEMVNFWYGRPIHLAARRGHKQGVIWLLDVAKVDIDSAGLADESPLSSAVCAGRVRTVQLFLDRGARVRHREMRSAIHGRHIKTQIKLIESGTLNEEQLSEATSGVFCKGSLDTFLKLCWERGIEVDLRSQLKSGHCMKRSAEATAGRL